MDESDNTQQYVAIQEDFNASDIRQIFVNWALSPVEGSDGGRLRIQLANNPCQIAVACGE